MRKIGEGPPNATGCNAKILNEASVFGIIVTEGLQGSTVSKLYSVEEEGYQLNPAQL